MLSPFSFFYGSKKWKKARERALRRDEYQCQDCKRYGKITAAEHVHHIKPLEDCTAAEAIDLSNLVSLCRDCHNKRHPEKARKATTEAEKNKYKFYC